MLHRLPELHRDADREHGHERAGQRRREEAGRELVEDGRDGNRERREVGAAAGREAARSRRPVHVETSEPASAAAIARCSAPCRRRVPPRKSQPTISSVVRIPAASASRLGSAYEAEREQQREEEDEPLP